MRRVQALYPQRLDLWLGLVEIDSRDGCPRSAVVARALKLQPPEPERPGRPKSIGEIRRCDRLGGLIQEYYRAAA